MDRTKALYERPVVAVDDAATFGEVKGQVERCFSEAQVREFLRSLEKSGLRVRDFESVLSAGKLGSGTAAAYAKLSPGDQGLVRELYLAQLEQVALPLRDKFFKLYAYY